MRGKAHLAQLWMCLRRSIIALVRYRARPVAVIAAIPRGVPAPVIVAGTVVLRCPVVVPAV